MTGLVSGGLPSLIVDFHNEKRANHGVPSVTWNKSLKNIALKKFIKPCSNVSCIIPNVSDTSKVKIREYTRQCLNQIYSGSACINFETGLKKTSIECSDINPDAFSRMIWKSSRSVGCHSTLTTCGGNNTFAFHCVYEPRTYSNFTQNVLPIAAPPPPPSLADYALERHNMYRARHQTPPLMWSTDVERTAQKWADRCIFEHSSLGFGENLALGHSSINQAVDDWYGEVRYYDYSNPIFGRDTGHFTQVVWVNSKLLGCAKGRCPGQPSLWVCMYSPPGNYYGQFARNVMPISGMSSSDKIAPATLTFAIIFPIIFILTIVLSSVVTRYIVLKRRQPTA